MQILGLCFDASAMGVPAHHDPVLTVVSYLAAALASFTAFDMTERLRKATVSTRLFWLLGAALVLGGGVWSMHFIAMLAYRTPLRIEYDLGLTVLSGSIAIVGVAAGLNVVRGRATPLRVLGGGALVGLSISLMHYMGMSAMRLPGEIFYRPWLFGLSIVIAVAAASAALWLSVTLHTLLQRAGAALLMAAAICGMHFTGMAGTVVVASPRLAYPHAGTLVSGSLLAAAIIAALAMILVIGLLCAYFDRRLERSAIDEARRLRILNESLESRVQARTAELRETLAALDEQKQHAEAANRSKSDFLANMSHELRTPLNAVIGFAQVLKMGAGKDALTARQSDAVEQIHSSGRHLLALIEEVLDFAKIESGAVSVAIEAVDPVRTARDLMAGFEFQASRAEVTLSCEEPPAGLAVFADRLRLKQVLVNLLSNAIKYNLPKGSVGVSFEQVGDRIQLSVKDTGLGIPADRLKDLFTPFERLGREAMGGELRVESVETVGSCFTVSLPAAPIDQLAPAAPNPVQRVDGIADVSILYIEDNASNIRLMRHICDALGGPELNVAEHPLEGLEMAALLRPNVILLDINLPDMDGFEVKARLEADPATREIPVIALSANALSETQARGETVGFQRYLTKPINIALLAEAIREAVTPASEQAKPAAGKPVRRLRGGAKA